MFGRRTRSAGKRRPQTSGNIISGREMSFPEPGAAVSRAGRAPVRGQATSFQGSKCRCPAAGDRYALAASRGPRSVAGMDDALGKAGALLSLGCNFRGQGVGAAGQWRSASDPLREGADLCPSTVAVWASCPWPPESFAGRRLLWGRTSNRAARAGFLEGVPSFGRPPRSSQPSCRSPGFSRFAVAALNFVPLITGGLATGLLNDRRRYSGLGSIQVQARRPAATKARRALSLPLSWL